MTLPKAVVFDRDGTLIEHVPYLCDPEHVRLLPGTVEVLRFLDASGVLLFVHTNQSGVGRGLFEIEDAIACNDRMLELIGMGKELFKEICIAPEHPEVPSKYRKPSPAFAREIAEKNNLELSDICYVGDRATDLQTANAAGTQGIGVATGLDDLISELQQFGLEGTYVVKSSLHDLLELWESEVSS